MKRIVHVVLFIVIALLLSHTDCMAQYKPGRQLSSQEVEAAADSNRLQFHGSIFSGIYSGFGMTQSYFGVAPTLTYQANDNLWISATVFAVAGQSLPGSCLAPYRNGIAPTPYQPGLYNLDLYGGSASLCFKTKHNNYLDFHVTVVRDNSGLMSSMLYGPYGGFGTFGMLSPVGNPCF